MESKICYACKQEKPATNEYFSKNKNKLDGLSSRCKLCDKEYKKKYYVEYGEEVRAKTNQYKKDNAEIVKERNKKYWYDNHDVNIQRSKEQYQKHKEERLKSCKEWRERNLDRIRETKKKYGLKNKDAIKLKRDEYRLNNKESQKIRQKKYSQSPKGKLTYMLGCVRRRTREKDLIATLTKQQFEECLKYFDYKDAYTGLPMEVISQDHVIPLSKGGGYVRQNIVPCEININQSKNDSDMEEWYRKQLFFSEERLKKIYKWTGYDEKTGIQQIALY